MMLFSKQNFINLAFEEHVILRNQFIGHLTVHWLAQELRISGWLKPQAKLSRRCWHFNSPYFLGSELVADEAPDLPRSSLDTFASI